MTDNGSIVLSIDAELAWGFHDLAEVPADRVRNARNSWLYVLDLLERHDIRSTWAVVGHLFPGSCAGRHDAHPAGEEWFTRDPGGEHHQDSIWFGEDLIDAIVGSTVDHEIGSHSFSHIEFGDRRTTSDIARAELRYSREVMTEYGLDPTSFVFPRNSVGHRDLLPEYGFTCYRGLRPELWYTGTPLQKVGTLVAGGLGTSGPPLVSPEIDEFGLVNIPASLFLFGYRGFPWTVVDTVFESTVVRQLKLGLNQLRNQQEGILHLWFHPNDIRTESDRDQIREMIALIATYRDRYGLTVETMSDVESRVNNNRGEGPEVPLAV